MACGAFRSLTGVPQRRVEFELVQRPGDELGISNEDLMADQEIVFHVNEVDFN